METAAPHDPLQTNLPTTRVMALAFAATLVPFLLVEWLNGSLYQVLDVPTYLVFHNVTEFFSVMVSFSIFGVGWYTFDQSRDRYSLFLSAAFLAIGLLDFMHTLGYAGMPDLVTPNSANKSTQFWIAARLFSAIAFFASAFVQPRSDARWLSSPVLLSLALAIPALVFAAVTFFPGQVPATFVPGNGLTSFKKISEYFIIILFTLAAAAYWHRIRRTGERALVLVGASFVICAVSELAFAVYSSVFDTFNVFGHLYKVAAFLLVYQSLFARSVKEPYAALRAEMAERCHAEDDSRRSRRLLDETYRLTRVGGWEYDLASGKLFWTGEIYRLYGVPPGTDPTSVLGKAFHPPADQARLVVAFERAREEGLPYDLELRLDNLRGERLWVRTVGRAERRGGKVVRLYGNIMDITEKKEAELEREQYFKLFSVSTDLMGIADPNGAFKHVNPAFTATLGWNEEELLARPFMEFIHPEDRQATAEEMARQLERGFSLDFENRYLCSDGSFRWLSWRAYVNRADGLTYATARDITERRQAHEDLRRQTEELRQRNEELEAFNEAMVGRELAMIRLKEQINELASELGRAPPFPQEMFGNQPAERSEPR